MLVSFRDRAWSPPTPKILADLIAARRMRSTPVLLIERRLASRISIKAST